MAVTDVGPRYGSMDSNTFWQIVTLIAGDHTVDLIVGRNEVELRMPGTGVVATGRSHDQLLERFVAWIEEQVDEQADQLMKVTLYKCGECEGVSSDDAWRHAWWSERARRMNHPAWSDDDYGKDFGLDEKMVCPRCQHVHVDDDTSYVEELEGRAVIA